MGGKTLCVLALPLLAGCLAPVEALRPSPTEVVRLAKPTKPLPVERVADLLAAVGATPARVHADAGIVVTRWCGLGEAPWYRRIPSNDSFWPKKSDAVVRFVATLGARDPGLLLVTPEVLFCVQGEWRTNGFDVVGRCTPEGIGLGEEPHHRAAARLASALTARWRDAQ
jgi:hypothetical protein